MREGSVPMPTAKVRGSVRQVGGRQHTAKSLFAENIKSAQECIAQFRGLQALKSALNTDWLLRAAVVFTVSALDTYFHDKIKYRVGRLDLETMPPALAKFQIPLRELETWSQARRKGNVLRNWIVDYLSGKALQSPEAIAEALKFAGIDDFWNSLEPNNQRREQLKGTLNRIVQRRNQIAHEGDRETSRQSGKRLRRIDEAEVTGWTDWAMQLVEHIETKYPK